MEYFSFVSISIPGVVYSICWLVDRKDQRKFCKTSTSAEIKRYMQVLQTSKRNGLPLVAKLRIDKKPAGKEIMEAA